MGDAAKPTSLVSFCLRQQCLVDNEEAGRTQTCMAGPAVVALAGMLVALFSFW